MSQQAEAAPPPAAAQPDGAATEILNLPRDFLSLRPQEHSLVPLAAAAAAAAAAATPTTTTTTTTTVGQQRSIKQEQQQQQQSTASRSPTATAKPLITVQMASSSPPALHKCTTTTTGTTTSTTTTTTTTTTTNTQQQQPLVYPRALATHAEVLADKNLFLDTLRRLHGSIGHKSLTIPTIGGTQLDLHLLYREVTARGGLQKVIKERIWKDIKAAFNFPPTTTNASYVLRKYYSSLLHHYEQVYFFRNEGNLILAPGDTPQQEILSDESDPLKMRNKRNYESSEAVATHATNCIGQMVTGSIEGKFEHGYLVSVTVGSEKLRGVLYNVPAGEYVSQFTTTSKLSNGNQVQALTTTPNYMAATEAEMPRKRRRRLGSRKKDPNAPKLNRSAYNFFFAEQRARIRLVQPNKEISRMIGDSWSKLTAEQRLPYQERGLVDKERYRKEIKQYREKIKMQACSNHTTPQLAMDVHEEEDSEEPEEHEHLENNGEAASQPASSGPSPPESSVQLQQQQAAPLPAELQLQFQSREQEQQQQETLKFKSILSSQP